MPIIEPIPRDKRRLMQKAILDTPLPKGREFLFRGVKPKPL